MSHRLHKLWLKITAVVVGSAAPLLFLGAMPAATAPARTVLGLLSGRGDGWVAYAAPDIRFLSALTGGFLLGWGMLFWRLSTSVYDLAPEAVRKAALTSLLAWCTLDSAGSIASGAPANAAFNVAFLALAVGPMWRPAKA